MTASVGLKAKPASAISDTQVEFAIDGGPVVSVALRRVRPGEQTAFERMTEGKIQRFTIYPALSVLVDDEPKSYDAVGHSEDTGHLIFLNLRFNKILGKNRYHRMAIRPLRVREVSLVD